MPLFVTSLASGSNGNCYYVGNDEEAVLIDAGISCREVEQRMKRLQLSLQKVKAIFISHEHADHIRGLAVLAAKYKIAVYGTAATLRQCYLKRREFPVLYFTTHEPVQIGGLQVRAFPKEHDAVDPHSFVVEQQGLQVGIFTDIGQPCSNLIRHFGQCHAAFLEANYDTEMLDKGRYPYYLKKRIRGGKGHLSNSEALQIFQNHRPPHLKHLFLSHLSKENNCPDLVRSLFTQEDHGVEVIVASRYEETPVYQVTGEECQPRESVRLSATRPRQIALF